MNLGAGVAPENYSPSADHETPLPQAHTGEPRDAEGTPAWLREIQPADQVSSKVTTHRLVKILAVVCTVGLLGCLAVGVCFLVKLLLRPATNHSSAGLGDAKETPFCNVTEDSTIADPRKVFYRISPENSLLEVQLEKLQTWLPVCYERWNSSLGNLVCRQLGYLRLTKHKGVNLTDIGPNYSDGFVQITSEHKTNLESLWQFRGESHVLSCPLNTMETNIRPDPVSHWAWRELYHRKGDSTEVFRVWDSSKAAPNNWRNGSHSGEVALASESPLQLQTYLRRLNYNAPLDSHRCTLRTQHGINLYLSLYVHFRDKTCLAFYPLQLPQVSSWVVFAGVVTRSSTKLAQHTGYAVEKILYHKNYNHRSHDNDIALIKLKTPLNFTDTIRPVCLPQYDHDFPGGTQCWISGWGYTRPDEVHIPETLKEASVPLISTKKCNSSCMYDGEITSRMLCAGYTEGQVDACQGDSGGPLVCQDDGVWRLVGVVSWGTGCAEPNHPGVYTKVAEFLGWIYDTIENY